MTRYLRALVALIGLVWIGAALALVVALGVTDTTVPLLERLEQVAGQSTYALVIGGLGGLCVLWVIWTAGPGRSRDVESTTLTPAATDFGAVQRDPPETATSGAVLGDAFEWRLDRDQQTEALQSELRDLAIEAVGHREGCSAEAARQRVDDGSWIDDQVVACFLADAESRLPVRYRLRAWLWPTETYRRRVRRSAELIRAYTAGETDD